MELEYKIMLISIVILNYKKSNLTSACIESLYVQFGKEITQNLMELIIVDNDSRDGSVKALKEIIKKNQYKNVSIIESKENGGFAKGSNLGAKVAKGDYLLFLNNDTVVKDKGILEMANYMSRNNQASILGGQLKNTDGSLQISVGKFYTLFRALMLFIGLQRLGLIDTSPKEISKVDWVKGALLMIRKEIFIKLSGFDENIFMYTEDMELCYRARLLGYSTYFYPKINVIHLDYGSTNRTFAIVNIYKNVLYFYKKHRSMLEYFLLRFVLTAKAYLLIILGTVLRSTYLKETYKQALEAIN